MKFHKEKYVWVFKRNILGEIINKEDRYYIYFWTWKGKRYIRFKLYSKDDPCRKVNFWSENIEVVCEIQKNKEYVNHLTKEEADYVIRNMLTDPNKYILYV